MLSPGTRIGSYEVVGVLGVGGMGEVYRAHDARLGRDVAVKVLPASVSQDVERLARFEQEARSVAALNHPNIIALHDIGVQGDVHYLVTELLEGQTLRDVVAAGAVPARRAGALAVQMAAGLAAAHEKGIVHRDLKPENVFVTPDDRVKILDFGLAKLVAADAEAKDRTALPTMTAPRVESPRTASGTVLGTIGYMAPEQVRGQAVDHRADVFAFGAILHELVSGRRAFDGDTPADTMTAILREDPAPSERPVPAGLARIVARCLEKQPAARFQSMRDLAFALESGATESALGSERVPLATAAAPSRRRMGAREMGAWALSGVLGMAAAVGIWQRQPSMSSPAPRVVFSVQPPAGYSLPQNLAGISTPAVSPNGRYVVFQVMREGRTMLAVRDLGVSEATVIPGTDGGHGPFFAPDSQSVGFFTQRDLMVASLSRGGVRTVLAGLTFAGFQASWGLDVILFDARGEGIQRVSASGGQSRAATTLVAPDVAHGSPAFLPDGKHFLYVARPSGTVYLAALDEAGSRALFQADSRAVYVEPGYLLFARGTSVFAQGFDAQAGRLVGEPQSVLDNITGYSTALTSVTPFSASDVGSLVYRVGANAPVSRLTWFDRLGTRLGEVGEPGRHRQIVLSPDARTVALNTFDDDGRLVVFLLDLLRNVATRFTSDRAGDPVWAPDSRALAFTQRGAAAIAQRRLDEATAHTLWESTERGVLRYVESWSPDGTGLVFEEGSAIGILPLDPGAKPFTWIDTPFDKDEPHFSPDGRWIAYQAFDSGSYEVYVQAYPKPGAQIRVSTAGGGAPRWRADGRELFYLTPDGALMAVAVTPGPSIQFGTPRQLFQTPITNLELNIDQYDVSPDGQRFLVLVPEPTDDLGVNVVLNWTSGLDATGRR